MRHSQHPMRQALTAAVPSLTLVVCALLCTAPAALSTSWPNGHDELRFHHVLDHFGEAVQHGYIYPRYLPNANGGYGYPTFLFYPPGFFFAALPFNAIFGDTVAAIYATIVMLVSIGGLGAYKTCREISDRSFAIFGAACFLLTPYLYVNLHVRNDFAELTSMMLCPWTVYCLLVLQKCQRNSAVILPVIALAASIAAVLLSHPATALFLIPSLFLMACTFGGREAGDGLRLMVLAGLAIAIAAVLTTPYWWTLFQMKPYVAHEQSIQGYYTAADHVVHLSQFISPRWEFGHSNQGLSDNMSFQLGLPHLLLAVTGTIASWRDRRIRVVAAIYVALLAVMTPLSSALWEHAPLLRFVQFPWRVLSVTATMQIVCIAGVHSVLNRLPGRERAALLLLVLINSVWWYSPQFFPGPTAAIDRAARIASHRENRSNEFSTYANMHEYTPNTAVRLQEFLEPRRQRPILELRSDRREMHLLPDHTVFNLSATISPGPPTDVIINQVYIPGWHVEVAGRKVSRAVIENQLLLDGRMSLKLDTTEQTLVAYYDGPPGRRLRTVVCGVLLTCLAAWGFISQRRRSLSRAERERAEE